MTLHDARETLTKHRLRVEDFLLLDRAAAFGGQRTELFDGEVFYMSPKHRPHARCVTKLVIAMEKAMAGVADELELLADVTIRLSDHDAPEPDIVIVSRIDDEDIVPAAKVRLVVEVSDSTLRIDLGLKAELYAGAGIPEYWVADVSGRVVHQMSQPGEGGYASRRELAFGERIEAETIAGLGVVLLT